MLQNLQYMGCSDVCCKIYVCIAKYMGCKIYGQYMSCSDMGIPSVGLDGSTLLWVTPRVIDADVVQEYMRCYRYIAVYMYSCIYTGIHDVTDIQLYI